MPLTETLTVLVCLAALFSYVIRSSASHDAASTKKWGQGHASRSCHRRVYRDPVGRSSLFIKAMEFIDSEPIVTDRSMTPLFANACPI